MKESMQKLREVDPLLNQTADELTAVVRAIEKELNDLNVGVKVEKRLSSDVRREFDSEQDRNVDFTEVTTLFFGRLQGASRIGVRVERCYDETGEHGQSIDRHETIEEKAWLECDRQTKIETFSALPGLLENLVKKCEAASDSVRKAHAAAKEFLGDTARDEGSTPIPEGRRIVPMPPTKTSR